MAMNSSVADKASRINASEKIVAEYVLNCKENNKTPSLKEFVAQEFDHIIELTDFRTNVAQYWTTIFINATEEMKVEGVIEEQDVSWKLINTQQKSSPGPDPTPSSSSNPPTASRTNSQKSAIIMTKDALKEVENSYKRVIESGKVWKLQSGRIVEEVMMEYALGLKYEHLVHSMILNLDDLMHADVFTEKELTEIGDYNSIDFDQELPKDLHEYLYSFIGKKSLDHLNTAIAEKTFIPPVEPDLYWIRKSIEEVVDLYNMKFFDNDYIEDDVEYRIWPFISKCFDLTEIRTRSGKRKSQASSDRHNEKHALSAHLPTARHHVDMQPDMKCMYMNYELGFSEVALKDEGEKGTKELYESGIKAPKMMKGFLVSIVRDRPSIVHSTKTAAFIISGLYMSVIIMDCPKGSICRVTQSERAAFPLNPDVCFPQLIPILELIYRTRLYLLDTVKAIKECNEVVPLGKKGKKRASLPSCITGPSGASSSSTTTIENESSSSSSSNCGDKLAKRQKQQ